MFFFISKIKLNLKPTSVDLNYILLGNLSIGQEIQFMGFVHAVLFILKESFYLSFFVRSTHREYVLVPETINFPENLGYNSLEITLYIFVFLIHLGKIP